jgi:hypothetical protein
MSETQEKTTKEKAEVMLAFDADKSIRMRRKDSNRWGPCPYPVWDWVNYDYEVAPGPRVVFANEYENGKFEWAYGTFSEAEKNRDDENGYIGTVKFIEDTGDAKDPGLEQLLKAAKGVLDRQENSPAVVFESTQPEIVALNNAVSKVEGGRQLSE